MSLTDAQLAQVIWSAKILNRSARDAYLRSIANILRDVAEPSNQQVVSTIRRVLETRGIHTGRKTDIDRLINEASLLEKETAT